MPTGARADLAPRLAEVMLGRLAPGAVQEGAGAEALWLAGVRGRVGEAEADPGAALKDWDEAPPEADRALHDLAHAMGLLPIERVAVALALAADTDPAAARALGWLQASTHALHPTVGLVATLWAGADRAAARCVAELLDGAALRSGLLQLDGAGRTLADAALRIPQPIVLAAAGALGHWPGVRLDESFGDDQPVSVRRAGDRCASLLLVPPHALVVRSAHPVEARAAAAAIARRLGYRAAFVEAGAPSGLGPWLLLCGAIPVWCAELAPGERQRVPPIAGYDGPVLVAAGLDGAWTIDGQAPPAWQVPLPTSAERAALWVAAGVDPGAAPDLGRQHRHAASRIRQLARDGDAERRLRGDDTLRGEHIHAVARQAHGDLGTLAVALPEDVPDAALVLPGALREELLGVLARCRLRDGLCEGLGPAALSRYRPGVRVLMVGPSGTGKTLTAGWLATRLGMPLYRVDLAAVTSKYIGETEKNLAELFARAEHAEVVLLFDEADALFGKRTDVKDANDRFANQQTNYLLQRIESFDGVVLLTSNSRSRFDAAFTRRLDAILEFPPPAADERRALWLAHLGDAHALDDAALNRLAASCDLAGGHVRNVTLAARVLSPASPIGWPALAQALAAEYRKLGKAIPSALAARSDG